MTDADLDKLEALAKAATQGPWEHDGNTGWMAPVLHRWSESGCCGQVLATGECCGYSVSQEQEAWDVQQIGSASPEDAAFIAAANPATILDLIASARRDAEEIERLVGYAVHDDTCTTNRFPGQDVCSCGLSSLLQQIRHKQEAVDAR